MDVAIGALPFYVAGFWIRRYNFFLFPHRFDKLIPLCILAALAVMYFTTTFVGMRTNNYAGNIFPILGLSLCRHIYDHAFLQEIQEAARHLVYGALLGHNTGHTRTFTPF